MSALKKRRISKMCAEAEPEPGSSPNLFLALDRIPLSVSFSQIEAFFRPIRLSGIKLDVSYGAVRAPQVEFFTVADRELALDSMQGKVIARHRLFLRSPKDMRAEKPGCGWEVVHPILQRELFSHFDICSRSKLQRVSKSWKNQLDSLDPRVKETLSFPITLTDGHAPNSYIFFGLPIPPEVTNSIKHITLSPWPQQEKVDMDETIECLMRMFGKCQKVSFIGGELSERWIAHAVRLFAREVRLRFMDCRVKFNWLYSASPLTGNPELYSCELSLTSISVNVQSRMDVPASYRAVCEGIQREYPAWDLVAWNNWWKEHRSLLDLELVSIIRTYFRSDKVRKFLRNATPVESTEDSADLPLNIRDCIFLRNFLWKKEVSLPPSLETMFADITFSSGKCKRNTIEYRIAFPWVADDWSGSESDDSNDDDSDDDESDDDDGVGLQALLAGFNQDDDEDDEDEYDEEDEDEDQDDEEEDQEEDEDDAQ